MTGAAGVAELAQAGALPGYAVPASELVQVPDGLRPTVLALRLP